MTDIIRSCLGQGDRSRTTAEAGLDAFLTQGPRPLIFAHRGGAGLGPEGTIPTFLSTRRDFPEQAIEFDLQQTKDGVMVVLHDSTVDRTTNGHGPISEMTLAEAKRLDAGFWALPGHREGVVTGAARRAASASDFPFRGRGYQVATLEEVFQMMPADTRFGIELKAAGFEAQFVETLRHSGRVGQVVAGSARDDVAVRLRKLMPELPQYVPEGAARCVLLSAKVRANFVPCPRYEVLAPPLTGAGLRFDTPAVIDAAHQRGMAIFYWSEGPGPYGDVNDPATIERLLRLRADGVFTDYPDRAQKVVESLRREESQVG